MTSEPLGLRDTPARFGRVTRVLHALTAALVLWQFAIVGLYKTFGESPQLNALARLGPHLYVGLAILALALARLCWAVGERDRRPSHAPGVGGELACAVHAAMYSLMIVVPALAMARFYGSGIGWTVWGIEVFAKGARKHPTAVVIADLLHSPLSWILLALIGGHATMAALHGPVWRSGVAGRMIGAPGAAPARTV